MRYLDQFDIHLRSYEKAFPLPNLAKTTQYIESTQKHIEEILKNVELGEPNPELVRITIEKFIEWSSKRTTKKFTWLEVALLCHGLLFEMPITGKLMQSEAKVKILLGRFFNLHSDFFMSAYCWQGLLNAYLNVSPRREEIYKSSWLELRGFLQTTLDDVARQSSFKPRWLDALLEYRIILTENATRILAEEALQGRIDRIDQIAREMNIPPTSWFWPELLMSQVETINAYPDEAFKCAISRVLKQLKAREECLDEGLAKILDRYASCSNTEEDSGLGTLVVSRWKSPSLEKQRDWERVQSNTKRMVQRWLAKKDITDVFGKLVEDHRRYEFWLQFINQIDHTFVWLGRDAREYFSHLLEDRKDRSSELQHPGKPDNNVILLKIRDIFIIESGAKAGGKCWAYSSDKIQPLLKKPINYQILLDKKRNLFVNKKRGGDGLIHEIHNWERTFQDELAILNIKPDQMSFNEILERYNLPFKTLPSGTEQVIHEHSIGTVADLLRQHGFSHSHKNGFLRNPRIHNWY